MANEGDQHWRTNRRQKKEIRVTTGLGKPEQIPQNRIRQERKVKK